MSTLTPRPPRLRIESSLPPVPAASDTLEVLGFSLDTESYAVPLALVKEILKVQAVTEVPRSPGDILGIVSLRGTVVTLVDLRRRVGLPARPLDRRSRILIVHRHDEPMGLLVDTVTEVVRLGRDEIEEKPTVVGTTHGDWFSGVARQGEALWVLLDLEAVLATL